MREALTLNSNAVNQHAKYLLSKLDPEKDPEYTQMNWSGPHLYLLKLMQWFLDQADQPYHPANQMMMEEKIQELKRLPPKQAWTWLGLGKRHEAIQQATTPRKGAYETTEILRMQLFYVTQEQEEVIVWTR